MKADGKLPQDPPASVVDPPPPRLTLRRFLKVLGSYLPYLRPHKAELALLFIVLPLAASVLVLVVPLCTKMALDIALPQRNVGLVVTLALVALGSIVLERTAMVLVRNTISAHLRIRIHSALGARFYENMLGLSMNYHHHTPVGEKIFRCSTDVADVSEMLGTSLPMFVQYAYQFLFTMLALCLMDWRPVAIALTCAPLFLLIAQVIFNLYRGVDSRLRLRGQSLTARLEESLSALAVILAHGTRRREQLRYRRELARYSVANMLHGFMLQVSIFFAWPSGLPALFSGFAMGLCGYWVVNGELSLGQWQALSHLVIQLILPMGILTYYYQQMRVLMVPAERILAVLDLADRVREHPGATDRPLRGSIEFRDVHFAYDPAKPVLRGVSFVIPAGSRTALVGPSGIGKSTIMNLLLRFFDPGRGQILVDGVDLRHVQLASYRGQVGIVLQEPVLFPGTVGENILYGAPHATDDVLKKVAQVTGLEEMVGAMPAGFATPLQGSGGLSLGQKQKLTVARCLARSPRIVLLDEPTALLDAISKGEVIESLERAVAGRTAVFISHELATLRNMDHIIVLNDGVVAEQGTHGELLERAGLYHGLWHMQREEAGGVLV